MHSSFWLVCVVLAFSEAAPKKPPQLSKAQLTTLADTAARKGELNSAIKYYDQLLKIAPTQLNFYKRSGLYIRQKKFDNARRDLKKAIEADPKFTKGFNDLGKVNLMLGDCDDAVANFQAVLSLKPADKVANEKISPAQQCQAYVHSAQHAAQQGNWENVKFALERALQYAYNSIRLLNMRSEAHFQTQDYQSLLVDTRTVLKLDKNDLKAMLLRGQAYYRMGEHDVSLRHYREGLRLDPEHKELKKAYNMLRKLVKLTNSAEEAQQQGDYANAAEVYQTAIQVDETNRQNIALLYIKKCECLHKSGDWQAGVDACTMAISYDEQNIKAWMERGEAKIRGEMYDDAIRDFKRATEIDENSQEARDALSRAELELKKSQRKNYYKILGVSNNANDKEIKRAYRKMALKWHPDKHKGEEARKNAEKEFREINEANEVLSDHEKRGRYDRGEDIEVQQQQNPWQHFQQGGGTFHFNFG